jgi:RimK family alpha-L-glutamate ligase
MKRIDEFLNTYLNGDVQLDNFVTTFYESSEDNAKLKEILKKYNDENFQKVKDKLQQTTVKSGHNVDEIENKVIYADLKKAKTEPTCIFKHIIVFTNDKNPENNKTLKNIYAAIEKIKTHEVGITPELHVFNCENTDMKEINKSSFTITDGEETMTIKDESNIDTLVFARLSVQNNEKCEHIVSTLQDRGLLVLNPIEPSEIACNKYETAVLLKENDIPQPNFCLMTKEILYDKKLYKKAMRSVYKEWDVDDTDKNEKLPLVIKILDGHGGTGVALVDGKKAYAILQLIFACSPEQNIIIQKKEEGDGGDIRVHVLTLTDKQVILGAMKRVKLGGDFRSNVSLGAEAEPIKLTEEQEQLALKTALISGLPWCAVDIMPLVKGSNKELGDNVILEINASPGTDGISSVLKTNFINILLNELTDPSTFYLQDKIAGYRETVTVDFGGTSKTLLAKLDTGNSTKATCIEVGEFEDDGKNISFVIDGTRMSFEKIAYSHAKSGHDIHERPIIIIPQIILGDRKLNNVPVSLVKSRDRLTNVLLNRDTMSKLGYVVHPNKTHILTDSIKKVKI